MEYKFAVKNRMFSVSLVVGRMQNKGNGPANGEKSCALNEHVLLYLCFKIVIAGPFV